MGALTKDDDKGIAKACGVSVSTGFAGSEQPARCERIRAEAGAGGGGGQGLYTQQQRQDLVRSRTDAIGVVVRGTGNLFFSAILKTVSREIDRAGFTMVPHFIGSDADEVKAGAILEREKKLRGLLFLGGRYDYTPSELALVGVPYVCCSYTNCFGSLGRRGLFLRFH